jgi:hypothetical protein
VPGEPRRGPPPPSTPLDFSTGSRTFLIITIILVSVLIVLTGILAAVLFVR